MIMTRNVSIIFVLLLSGFSSYSEESPQFRLGWTVQNSPWFYENTYKMNNISVDSSLMLGWDFKGLMISVEPFCDYYSLNGQDSASLLQGAWLNIGGTVDTYFKPMELMEIKAGAGGFFQRSVFQYNNSGWLPLNRFGISGQCDIRIIPLQYLDFVLMNRFDTIFAFDGTGSYGPVLPNYYGCIKMDVHPGLQWLAIFVEANAFYWSYGSEIRTVASWMFQAQVGFNLEFGFTDKSDGEPARNNESPTITGGKNLALVKDEKTADASNTQADEKKPENTDPALIVLGQSQPGTFAAFTTIVFEKGKDTLAGVSASVLEKVSDILTINKKITISIEAYAEFSGNPILDLELIKSRAATIKSYFLKNGVEKNRIKVSSAGHIINNNTANAESPKVIIRILSN
jgi:outer membrane protein OmpA-like peptidoglycan-associated protein